MSGNQNRGSSGPTKSATGGNQPGAQPSNGGYGRPLGPGGGFGQGGYGRYGTDGPREPATGVPGTWGNEPPESTAATDETDTRNAGLSPDDLAASEMDEEGGGSRPARDVTNPRLGRWQREAITAGQIMSAQVMAAAPNSTVREIASIMKTENCGVVPVVDGDQRLIGVVTDRDIVIRACAEGRDPSQATAREVMTTDVEAVTPDEEIRNVIELMGERQIRRIPVVDKNDRLLGIISMADIANRADYDEDLEDALERVSAQ